VRRRTESLLWLGAAFSLILSLTLVRAAGPEPLPARAAAVVEDARWPVPAESLGARVLRVVATDPFRFTRAPSPVPFGTSPAGSAPTVSAVQVPDLQLRGIIGPPWSAVLESASGSSISQLVRAGDSVAGARVMVVRADAVTLRTPDSTWTLKLRRP
jgi:hypothetical protein